MNYKQAKLAQPHAPGVIKVLEGLEWVCKICKHISPEGDMDDYSRKFMVASSGLSVCRRCGGKGKVHYTWDPQVGEWCVWEDEVRLIENVSQGNVWCVYNELAVSTWEEANKVTPILECEEIERVLERAGYKLYLTNMDGSFKCRIYKGDEELVLEQRKTRLISVYEAVKKLGKEIKNE